MNVNGFLLDSDKRRKLRTEADHEACRRRKQERIYGDIFHIDTTDTDTMAKMREVQKEKSLERSAEERADILNRIQLRYYKLLNTLFMRFTNVI